MNQELQKMQNELQFLMIILRLHHNEIFEIQFNK